MCLIKFVVAHPKYPSKNKYRSQGFVTQKKAFKDSYIRGKETSEEIRNLNLAKKRSK